MYPTRNDLPETVRTKVIAVLNDRLADSIALYHAAKHAHWNVRGPSFVEHHELFDGISKDAQAWADDLAERAVQLGGVADGNIARVVKRASVPALAEDSFVGLDVVAALADVLARYGRNARAAIDATDDAGDKDTADLFTGISRGADKHLWFLEAHIETKPGKKKK